MSSCKRKEEIRRVVHREKWELDIRIKRDVGIEAAAEIRESLGTRRYNKEAVAIQNGLWTLLRALFDSRNIQSK